MRLYLILFLLMFCACSEQDMSPVFNGDSGLLKKTEIVGVLDTEIKSGKNLIWCSTLISAWKEIEKNITKKAPILTEKNNLVDSLNAASDPSSYVPEEAVFATAGLVKDGVIDKIRAGLAKKFPNKNMPNISAPTPDSLVAYAYLEAGIQFTIPYHVNDEAFDFKDSLGKNSQVKSFGIFDSDDFRYTLADQIGVLYARGLGEDKEFIVDLDDNSKKYQIVLARIKPQKGLTDAVNVINEKIKLNLWRKFSKGNTLIVPQTIWKISHSYSELINKKFNTDPLKGYPIFKAEQSIEFKLYNKGVEVKSEMTMEAKDASKPEEQFDGHYDFNKPFYILMRKKGEDQPFFVMYVDNAELLHSW